LGAGAAAAAAAAAGAGAAAAAAAANAAAGAAGAGAAAARTDPTPTSLVSVSVVLSSDDASVSLVSSSLDVPSLSAGICAPTPGVFLKECMWLLSWRCAAVPPPSFPAVALRQKRLASDCGVKVLMLMNGRLVVL